MEDEIFKDLVEKGILYLSDEITSGMAEQFGRAMVWLNASRQFDEIGLFIDSQGGSTVAGLQMYEVIRYSRIPVRGVVYRRAFSAAAIVLQACHTRVAFSSAEILFHDNTAKVLVTDTEQEIAEKLKFARRRQESLHRIIAAKGGKSIEEAAEFSRLEMRMSAIEALERGFVDELIELIP